MKNLTAGKRCAAVRSLRPLCLMLTILGLAESGGEAATLVVPLDFAAVDGNDLYADTPPPTSGCRVQEVYTAAYFTNMMSRPGVLVQMACRPDRLVTTPRTVVLRAYELRLSTTQRGPGSLSSRFDDNLGADTTLVFSGDLTWSTQGAGPSLGPRPSDYVIPFQYPFVYDPSQGNLLVEWRVGDSPEGRPAFDAHLFADGKIRLRYGASATASTSTFSNAGLAIRELTVEPLELAIWPDADAVNLVVTGPPGWSGRVQHSSDLETWTDWFDLTFEAAPYQTNDLSAATPPQQFYRVTMP
ncbi:MAG: hypothetical protein AB9869_24195 [Verrucomicrobiia bacterium]